LEAFSYITNLVAGTFIYNIIYNLITPFINKCNLNLYLGDNLVNENNKNIKKITFNFMENNNNSRENTPNSTEFS